MWRDRKKVGEAEFSTPPPPQLPQARTWRSAPCSPMQPLVKKQSPVRPDSFHIVHKVPTGDSPYVKAKQVQLIDRDPNKAISLFWSAINSGDRVDSALKDMAIVMKQLDRTEEAIEAIKSFRHLCTYQAQGSLDNVLIDLYKRAGRIDDHIQLLHYKLKLLDEGVGFGGKRTKVARSQGKRFHVSIDQERSRLLGNLAWAYMQQNNYQVAEGYYREALYLEPDKNKQCNLAVCVMERGNIMEAKALLQAVRPSCRDRETADSYIKSYDRAVELLNELESQHALKPNDKERETKTEVGRYFSSPININSKPQLSSIDRDGTLDWNSSETLFFGDLPYCSAEKWKRETHFQNQFENGGKGTSVGSIFIEQGNSQQPSQSHPAAVKWEKGFSWLSPLQRGADFKNGNWVSKMGIEEGSASKNFNGDGDTFDCPVSINRKSELHISWEHDASKKLPTVHNFPNPLNSLTESPVPVENPGVMPSQNPGGELQATVNQHWDSKTEIGLSDNDSENVKEKNIQGVYNATELNMGSSTANQDFFSLLKNGKSWADMVEEEEEFLHGNTDFDIDKWEYPCQESSVSFRTPSKWVHGWNDSDDPFSDENIDSNIISPAPPRPPTSTRSRSKLSSQAQPLAHKNHMEDLQKKLEFLDLKEEQCVKNTDNYSFKNPTARRALSFDEDQKKTSTGCNLPSPLQKKALDFDDYSGVETIGSGSTCGKDSMLKRRGNRLKVFHDITTLPDSPSNCGNRLKVFQDITHPGRLKA